MSAELQNMKGTAEIKSMSTEREEDRYPGGIPELRHVIQIVDAQMRSAAKTQNQNAALETMISLMDVISITTHVDESKRISLEPCSRHLQLSPVELLVLMASAVDNLSHD